jgi:hypothetical protein
MRQMILRMTDKKILLVESRMQIEQQKLETPRMMREMVAQGGHRRQLEITFQRTSRIEIVIFPVSWTAFDGPDPQNQFFPEPCAPPVCGRPSCRQSFETIACSRGPRRTRKPARTRWQDRYGPTSFEEEPQDGADGKTNPRSPTGIFYQIHPSHSP